MQDFLEQHWLLLVPIFIIQIVLMARALIDLFRRQHVLGNKWVWALIIVFVGYLGPIVYFIFGRRD